MFRARTAGSASEVGTDDGPSECRAGRVGVKVPAWERSGKRGFARARRSTRLIGGTRRERPLQS
jgi:hypothetical protein